jgi:hypothetical protein
METKDAMVVLWTTPSNMLLLTESPLNKLTHMLPKIPNAQSKEDLSKLPHSLIFPPITAMPYKLLSSNSQSVSLLMPATGNSIRAVSSLIARLL